MLVPKRSLAHKAKNIKFSFGFLQVLLYSCSSNTCLDWVRGLSVLVSAFLSRRVCGCKRLEDTSAPKQGKLQGVIHVIIVQSLSMFGRTPFSTRGEHMFG